jgi:hypothetical protein
MRPVNAAKISNNSDTQSSDLADQEVPSSMVTFPTIVDSETSTKATDPLVILGNNERRVIKSASKVLDYIYKVVDEVADNVIFSCKHCNKTWKLNLSHWRSKGSVTSNFTRHLQLRHKRKVDGGQKIGPMDSFVGKISTLDSYTANGQLTEAVVIPLMLSNW